MDSMRPTWAEIDLGAITHNITTIRQLAGEDTRIMAVVKADAYGHGMLKVSEVCREQGVDYLGVATMDEAMALLQAGIHLPVLVLGYTPPECALKAIENEIRVTVFDLNFAAVLSRTATAAGRPAYIHLKVDTGMSRLGFPVNDDALEDILKIADLPGLHIEGIFTHFAESDNPDPAFTQRQLHYFKDIIAQLEKRGLHIPLQHCSNSAAIIKYPEARFTMVRAGIILYGLYPSPAMKNLNLGIKPAMTLKSQVSFIKDLHPGDTVSYGRTYTCQKETRVVTVPVGYADGYSRLLSNRARAVIKGHRVDLIGVVCMDQCIFDIGQLEGIHEGDEVILFGKPEQGVTADELAEIIGTINYEILCSISARVPRTYVRR